MRQTSQVLLERCGGGNAATGYLLQRMNARDG